VGEAVIVHREPAATTHPIPLMDFGLPLGKKCRYKINIVKHKLKKKVFSEKYCNFVIINCFYIHRHFL